MASAVKTVGVGPGFDGFFAIGPDQPDAVAIALFSRFAFSRFPAAQLIGKFEQDGGRRSAVVGADVSDIAQWVVGVVMAHDDDDAVFGAGKFRNDVADGEFSFDGIRGEGVVFYLVTFQVVDNVAF